MSSASLSESARIRARIQFRFEDNAIGFEVIASPQPDGLVVVGLAPYGARLFTVHQRDREFHVDAGFSVRLRSLAFWTMDALHRAYWIEPTDGAPDDSAAAYFEWGEEEVLELQRDGQRQRLFARAGSDFAAPGVTIDYAHNRTSGGPGLSMIRNEWCGYEALVAVLDE